MKASLLGATAALACTDAAAVNLSARQAAPVDYVRICDFTGVGFFYIPGTDTCLQIGGLVRVEAAFINQTRAYYPTATVGQAPRPVAAGSTVIGRDQDVSGFWTQGRLTADTRTQTAYGTLRGYVRYNINRYQGLYQFGGVAGGSNSYANQGGNLAVLNRAFIQFTGITAGRVQSLFDFYADNYNYEHIAGSNIVLPVLAYTAKLGAGLIATLSVESHEARTDGIGSITGFDGRDASLPTAARYAGSVIPDIVSVLRDEQAWGAAQLSAAYHQVNTAAGPFTGTGGLGFQHRDGDGFAVQGGVHIELPMLAVGDDLWVQSAYQNGAYLYQDSAGYANAGFYSRDLGGFQHFDHDAVAVGTGAGNESYTMALSRGFSAMAAINHYLSATFHDVLFGSYEQSAYGRAKLIDWTLGGLGDMSEYRGGNQFLWDPVKNFEIGLEVDYAHIDQTLAHNPGQAATPLPAGISKNADSFEAHLRFERDF